MYWQDASYNSGNHTYYYSGASVSNHDVDLVGWDDTKATAGGAGAWLVKNSWGTSFGDGGYFWLSYNDGVAARSSAAYLTASNAAYSDIHQNQTDAAGSWWSFSDGAARFSTTTSERLKAVGFQVRDYGAQYTLGVYSTWSGDAPSGLLATKTGTLDWPGYYLIDLAAPVVLENNDDFVVTLNLPSVGGSGNRVAVDANSGDPAGVTYYSTNGVTWTDMQGLSGNNILFLKALALAYLAGDCDRNDKVEFTDYQLLESGFGAATGATWAMGDFDANGTVNFTDYQLLEANFGQGIPEPATAGLLLAGLALAARRRG